MNCNKKLCIPNNCFISGPTGPTRPKGNGITMIHKIIQQDQLMMLI